MPQPCSTPRAAAPSPAQTQAAAPSPARMPKQEAAREQVTDHRVIVMDLAVACAQPVRLLDMALNDNLLLVRACHTGLNLALDLGGLSLGLADAAAAPTKMWRRCPRTRANGDIFILYQSEGVICKYKQRLTLG